jgi:hypothetical protein
MRIQITKRLRTTFSWKLRGKSYQRCTPKEQEFIDAHLQNFKHYKLAIGQMLLVRFERSCFLDCENAIIEQWYFQKIPLFVISNAKEGADRFCEKKNIQYENICFLRKFVKTALIDHYNYRARISVGSTDYTDMGKDPWMFKEWCREYWRTNDRYFDFFRGPL